MADFDPSSVGANAAANFARMQMEASAANSGKPSPVLACILPGAGRDVKITSLSPEGISFLSKPLPTIKSAGRPGICSKFASAMQSVGDNFLKSIANTGIQAPTPISGGSIGNLPSQFAQSGGDGPSLS